MVALTPINRALQRIPRRAEKQEGPQLHETFVDSGIADLLDSVDHQVLYGRRGTGKTHAFNFLAAEVMEAGDLALVIDLRTIGSADGVFDLDAASPAERSTRLLVDLLGQVHNALLEAVLSDETLIDDGPFVAKADALLASITSVRVRGDVERTVETTRSTQDSSGAKAELKASPSTVSATVGVNANATDQASALLRETRKGHETHSINFGDVARALRELGDVLTTRRIYLLLDEWSSIPRDLQPYLSEFLLRCVLPLQRFTVKIAAIEQQTNFRADINGRLTGLELGADIGAHINLDDYLVYEGNEERARDFFRNLFFKHLVSIDDGGRLPLDQLTEPADFVRHGFADARAFDELVRAAEGVPRDALYIAARAGSQAQSGRITVPLVRQAARYWYQSDKSKPLESRAEAQRLLDWTIQRVIREKRARAFLVGKQDSRDPLLQTLFDARVLHVVRRGYSAQDDPGVRYDVWSIDYGAYVDLLQTKNAPQGLLAVGEDTDSDPTFVDVDVPVQDLRAIRRAVLDLSEFDRSGQAELPSQL